MKKIYILALFFILSFAASAQKQLNVYVFIAEECPICIYMTKPLKEVVKANEDKANFYAVFTKSNSTLETANGFLTDLKMESFEPILDTKQQLAKKMQAVVTPEVVVTDQDGITLYRGRISNAYRAPGKMKHGVRNNDLLDIMTKLTVGERIAEANWQQAVGCFITFSNPD